MQEKCYLVLDIGTEAVKAGISKETTIQYYDRFGIFNSRNFEEDVIKKAILKAIENLQSQTRLKAKSVLLALPPHVLRARISLQSLEMGDPKKEISQEILRKNKKEVSEAFLQESGILPQELEFLEQLFLETKIDGYLVPSFHGYQGRRAEAKILSIFSTREDLASFRKIFQELGLKVLKIIHPVQNLTKVFADRDGIFLDIGGKITQVFLVKNGKLEDITDFPMGGEDFSRILSQTLGLEEERARVLKERYSKGNMSEGTRKKFNEILSEVSEEWHRNLKLKLRGLSSMLTSQKFFLFGGGSQLPEIQDVLIENIAIALEEKYSLVEIFKNPQEINLILLSNAR
jgi:cell division ATPase FtsA